MKSQRGFTLVSAIFLLVVLAALGTSLVTLSTVAHTTSAQQLQTVRATYAARAGMEWAVNRAGVGACAAATLNVDGFTVAVSCTASNHTISQTSVANYNQIYYLVNVTATRGSWGSNDYVMRKLEGKVLGPVPP